MYQALKGLNLEQKNKFIIFNLGFSQAISNDNGFIVRNIKSRRDPIPSLMAPFSCCHMEGNIYNIKKTNNYTIFNVPNKSDKKFDHTFNSETYNTTLINMFETFPNY